MIVGVDEAGRGPLCGPVVAGAFSFKRNYRVDKTIFKDSKKIPPQKREELFSLILEAGYYHLGIATPREIEKYNILGATMLAFERAIRGIIKKLSNPKRATFIIDGNIFSTSLKIKYKCIEKADEKIKEVACASILAKVFRDYLMQVAGFLYPEWKFEKHKGYPTLEHRKLIKKFGLTPLHRRNFSFLKRERVRMK